MRKKENSEVKIDLNNIPNHVAIILDGNGRWAKKRGLPRIMGHQKGINTLEKIVKEAKKIGIKNLTVFAFSTENINRPKDEVSFLMSKFTYFFKNQYPKLIENNINVQIIGEYDNLSTEIIDEIKIINDYPYNQDNFTFTIAFNYGAHKEITNVVKKIAQDVKSNKLSVEQINEDLIESNLYTKRLYPLDLLIRTSGEYRISNFLLWQISYTELYFTNTYFPDFNEKELNKAIIDYQSRDRRFGKIGEQK